MGQYGCVISVSIKAMHPGFVLTDITIG